MDKECCTGRELITYEYMIKVTPEYCYDITEAWTLVDVFIKYLDSGFKTNVLVFRRRL